MAQQQHDFGGACDYFFSLFTYREVRAATRLPVLCGDQSDKHHRDNPGEAPHLGNAQPDKKTVSTFLQRTS